MTQRIVRIKFLVFLVACLATSMVRTNVTYGVDLLLENFDELALQQIVTFETEVRSRAAWTPNLPSGAGVQGTWEVDNSQFNATSLGDPLDGVTEFEGWTIVDKQWWLNTAGDQDRSQFVSASGNVMVADPDEWDDFGEADNNGSAADPAFKSSMFIRSIPLQGIAANTAKLSFHSSWRPEDTQAARLTVSYNDPGATSIDLFRWTSIEEDPDFHTDETNETINLNLFNPAGATSATLEFFMEGQNDWWWAVDNLSMFTGENPLQDGVLRLVIDRDTQEVKIKNNTGAAVNLRGYSIESAFGTLDESAATYKGDGDSNWLILDSPTSSELSEGYLLPSFNLAATQEIDLGTSWRQYSQDANDISFVYSVAGEADPQVGIIQFVGNGGNTYDYIDLNFDGNVDLGDYQAFLNGYGSTPLAGLTQAQRNVLSDLDNDSVYSVSDFIEFKRRYDQALGAGAFAAMLASVPEPGSLVILLSACGMGLVFRSRGRRCLPPILGVMVAALAIVMIPAAGRLQAQQLLYLEDFEGVALTTSPEEDPNAGNVWNETGPTGWTIDDSQMPPNTSANPADVDCINPGDCDGVTDWNGWAFVDKDFWVEAAGDQGRALFSRSTGKVMVADPDEWDDATVLPSSRTAPYGYFNAFATTQTISIPAGIPASKIFMAFDSSWRPEGPDELGDSNNQRAKIEVKYGTGAFQEVLNWESDVDGNNFKAAAENEGVELNGTAMGYNGAATTMELRLSMTQAVNDWWWAVDNLRVFIPAEPSILTIDRSTGQAELSGGDVITATINSLDIASANGNLAPAGAVGLSSLGVDSIGSGINNNWQLATAGENQFSEFFLAGSSTFTNSRTESLGKIYDQFTPEAEQDLEFTYTTIFGDVISGIVVYEGEPQMGTGTGPGDFDGLGTVGNGDLTLLLDGWGGAPDAAWVTNTPASVGNASLTELLDNWGTNYAGGVAAVAVPEPSGFMLVAVMIGLFGLSRCKDCGLNKRGSNRRGLDLCQMALAKTGLSKMSLAPVVVSEAVLSPTVLSSVGRPQIARGGVQRPLVGGLILVALLSGFSIDSASAQIPPPTLDRDYGFGDDDPGAVHGGIVGANDPRGENRTRDGEGLLGSRQLIDIKAVGAGGFPKPKYETIVGRPDGVNGNLGIRLNPNSFDKQSIQSGRDEGLNFPELSFSSTESITTPPGIIDYGFVTDRFFQLWVQPGDRTGRPVEDQHIVMDTNNHGVMINAAGKFSMRYSYNLSPTAPAEATKADFAGVTAPVVDSWYHLMVGRPFGPGRTGSVLYVNGVAEAAANGKYIGEDVPNDEANEFVIVHDRLVIGGNTTSAGGGEGTSNFFTGVVDDLEMSVMGLNNSADFGEFKFERDNDYAAFFKPTTPGDLDDDDDVDLTDAATFASNWLFENRVNNLLVGDLASRAVGDFNYDGRVDLGDWNILNDASPAAAAAAMGWIQSVPEPTAIALIALGLIGAVAQRPRRFFGSAS